MAQKKAHQVEDWIRRPDQAARIVLVYGPDRGLVSETAARYAATTGLPLDDPFCTIRLDADEIDREPGKLVAEAGMVPMFAERRLVWVRGASGQKNLVEDVGTLLESPPEETLILIEASDLKKTAALRKRVETAPAGMALPCYRDDARGLDGLIDEELTRAGLSIGLEARELLRINLGGDRLASRAELAKLALYCQGRKEIAPDDVRASTGDVSAESFDEAVDAVLSGQEARFDRAFARIILSGSQAQPVLAAALRQFQTLQMMRHEMETNGRNASAVVASARPPVFFARRRAVEAALQKWNPGSLARALEKLQAAVLRTRRQPGLALSVTRQALLGLAIEARLAEKR